MLNAAALTLRYKQQQLEIAAQTPIMGSLWCRSICELQRKHVEKCVKGWKEVNHRALCVPGMCSSRLRMVLLINRADARVKRSFERDRLLKERQINRRYTIQRLKSQGSKLKRLMKGIGKCPSEKLTLPCWDDTVGKLFTERKNTPNNVNQSEIKD